MTKEPLQLLYKIHIKSRLLWTAKLIIHNLTKINTQNNKIGSFLRKMTNASLHREPATNEHYNNKIKVVHQ